MPLVNASISIGSPANSFVDAGQYQSITASGLTGTVGTNTFTFYIVNSIAPYTIANVIVYSGVTGVAQTATWFVGANEPSNSPMEVNVVVTGSTSGTSNTLYSTTYNSYTTPQVVSFQATNVTDFPQKQQAFNILISGGSGPFTANLELFGTTVNTINNVLAGTTANMVDSSGSSYGNLDYQVNVIDTGTSVPFSFNSVQISVEVDDPSFTTSSASNTVMDIGQSTVLSAALLNPMQGTGVANFIYTNNGVVADSVTGLSSGSDWTARYAFKPTAANTYSFNAIATDLGTTKPYSFSTFPGLSNTVVTVAAMPELSLIPDSSSLTAGQSETFTVSVLNGVGPFTIELYNATGGMQQGSNVIIQSSGGSNTVSLTAGAAGTFVFNAIATDQGTTTPFVFNSVAKSISVQAPQSSGCHGICGSAGSGVFSSTSLQSTSTISTTSLSTTTMPASSSSTAATTISITSTVPQTTAATTQVTSAQTGAHNTTVTTAPQSNPTGNSPNALQQIWDAIVNFFSHL